MRILPILFAVCSTLLFAACTGPNGAVCERAANCGGGGDFEIAACIAELDADEEIADIYDCSDRFNDYVDCLDEVGMCDGDKLNGCNAQKDSLKDCVDDRERGKAKID